MTRTRVTLAACIVCAHGLACDPPKRQHKPPDTPPARAPITHAPPDTPAPTPKPVPEPAPPESLKVERLEDLSTLADRTILEYRGEEVGEPFAYRDAHGIHVFRFHEHLGRSGPTPVIGALHVTHALRHADSGHWQLERTFKERMDSCWESDAFADPTQGDWSVTDLDEDGVGEATFAYTVGCQGDDEEPKTHKVLLVEMHTKYALRGKSSIGGTSSKPRASFEGAPEAFLAHAKAVWEDTSAEQMPELAGTYSRKTFDSATLPIEELLRLKHTSGTSYEMTFERSHTKEDEYCRVSGTVTFTELDDCPYAELELGDPPCSVELSACGRAIDVVVRQCDDYMYCNGEDHTGSVNPGRGGWFHRRAHRVAHTPEP